MKSHKKIWEVQHQTVCKVIGMALDFKDLKKIANKFGISPQDPLMDHEFALHSTAVQLCASDNPVARHIQKTIETRFAKYSKRLSQMDALKLIERVTQGGADAGIPLWAIVWDLATRGLNNGASVETALFGFIHMLEHRLLKEFSESAVRRDEQSVEDTGMADESARLKRQVLDLQNQVKKSRKLSENLRIQLAQMTTSQGRASDHPLQQERPVMAQSSEETGKISRLRDLLEDTRAQKRNLEEECFRLRSEMEALVRDASVKITQDSTAGTEMPTHICPLRNVLAGKHVTMVGGLGSLECHYRRVVEEMGGSFHRHDGDCRRGECLLEDCIKKANLVVCPVEVNSHNAAKSVKKICKLRGIPCCFPRTAGLTGFRKAIEEHYAKSDVA